MKLKSNIFYILVLLATVAYTQNTILQGTIVGEESVESIHIINQSQTRYATSNEAGDFKIEAKQSDTIVFTSIQYKPHVYIVTADNIKNKALNISLEIHVNTLPEALIGFTLTGDLTKDVLNSDTKRPINFYDVGIPGYTGKKKTKSERLLFEAGEFKPSMLVGLLMGGLPLNPILNGLSGRTKKLKKRVALEANTTLMNAIKNRLSEVFFKENKLKEELRADFFYFCAEDETFQARCAYEDLEALKFMKEKYIKYQENRAEKE